jgi:predicted Zn finger-like uncharacterized protein
MAEDGAASSPGAQTCAICLEETPLADLPCCDNATTTESTTRFCLECLRMNCEHGGGVARCPRCRAWISVEDDEVVAHDGTGRCSICMQEPRVLVARGRAPDGGSVAICDACWLGNQIALRYECQGCGGVQRIPHPMWRYQTDGPEAFGHTPWACHVRCGTYTRWRVISEDVARVPHGDAPESWGVDIVWQIRARQGRERRRAVLREAGERQARERQGRAAGREDRRPARVARAARAVEPAAAVEPAVELHDAMAAEEEAGRCRVM